MSAGAPNPSLATHLAGWVPTLAMVIGLHRWGSVWAAMALYHGLVLLYLALNRGGPSWRLLQRGWRPGPGIALIVLGALAGLAIHLLHGTAELKGISLGRRLADLQVPPDRWWLFCAYYLAVTPWLEEWFWRGHLASLSRLPDRSDVMFSAYHVLVLVKFLELRWVGAAFLVLAAAAWLWRQVRRRTGGLLVPLLSHLAADLSVVAAVSLVLQR